MPGCHKRDYTVAIKRIGSAIGSLFYGLQRGPLRSRLLLRSAWRSIVTALVATAPSGQRKLRPCRGARIAAVALRMVTSSANSRRPTNRRLPTGYIAHRDQDTF